jgi:hypothetical protein
MATEMSTSDPAWAAAAEAVRREIDAAAPGLLTADGTRPHHRV